MPLVWTQPHSALPCSLTPSLPPPLCLDQSPAPSLSVPTGLLSLAHPALAPRFLHVREESHGSDKCSKSDVDKSQDQRLLSSWRAQVVSSTPQPTIPDLLLWRLMATNQLFSPLCGHADWLLLARHQLLVQTVEAKVGISHCDTLYDSLPL
jgi:hypothetical protein